MTSIALITSYAPSLCNFRAPLIRCLVSRGLKVLALAPEIDDKTRAELLKLGAIPVECPMSRTGINPLLDLKNALAMFFILRRLRPDITFGYFIKPVIFGSIAAKLAGVPRRFAMVEGLGYAFTLPDFIPLKRRILRALVCHMYKIGMACAHRVFFLNPDDRDELIDARVVSLEKTILLGGIGVDFTKWPPSPPTINPVTFLMVARLLREKGVEHYVAAARIVKNCHPAARFILLGGLDNNPGAINIESVKTWVSDGTIEWYGHVSVQPWMEKTSVFVLPSYREGVPASTQEAMSMGRAVITTDAPGCRETVIDGVNGFLVPVRDCRSLAEKMTLFIERPQLIISMGQASREIAQERFDSLKVNERLMTLLLGEDMRG